MFVFRSTSIIALRPKSCSAYTPSPAIRERVNDVLEKKTNVYEPSGTHLSDACRAWKVPLKTWSMVRGRVPRSGANVVPVYVKAAKIPINMAAPTSVASVISKHLREFGRF